MFNKHFLGIILCSSLMLLTIAIDFDKILEQQQQSLQAMWRKRNERSSDIQSRANIDDCFNWYFDVQNSNMQTYRTDTDACDKSADAAKKLIDDQGADTRNDFSNRGQAVSNDINECDNVKPHLEFVECYYRMTSNDAAELYNLSKDAKAEYNAVSVKHSNIDSDCNVCKTNVRDKYIKDSADSERQFTQCKNGGEVPEKPGDDGEDESPENQE